MIYTILNITILAANFIILIYTLKSFGDIVEESLLPKLSKIKETLIDYVYSALNVRFKEFEIKVFQDIAKIVQDQHDAKVKENENNSKKAIIYKGK